MLLNSEPYLSEQPCPDPECGSYWEIAAEYEGSKRGYCAECGLEKWYRVDEEEDEEE